MTKTPQPPLSAYIDATEQARRNMKQGRRLKKCIRPQTYRWARPFRPIFHLPYLIGRTYVRGFEHMPTFTEDSPIVAFAHKKIHDFCAVTEFMMARPIESFHNLTLVAQGGLFNGIYPWRDLTPGFLQKSFMRRPMAVLARLLGRGLKYLMDVINANPVFREGSDLPLTKKAYDDPAFAGELIMGMPYAEFVKFANRATITSVITTQREIESMNRTFLIFPEGIYMHDGAIAPMQDLTGMAAFRKQRKTHFISLCYDELCPDRLHRLDAWFDIAPLQGPPAGKEDISEFLNRGHELLQANTTILSSNLIALALRELRERESFSPDELTLRFHELADKTVAGPHPFDSGLTDSSYREDRLRRFFRAHKHWLQKRGEKLFPVRERMGEYMESERTVNDIDWNCNNVRHAWEYLGITVDAAS